MDVKQPPVFTHEEKVQQHRLGERFVYFTGELTRLDGPDSVARFLTMRGVTGGSPGSVVACPIAIYLSEKVGAPVFVENDATLVCGPINSYSARHTQALRAFISAFDGGAYPQLELGGSDSPVMGNAHTTSNVMVA